MSNYCYQVTKSLRDTINDIQQKIGKRMYELCLSGRMPEAQDLLYKEDTIKIKRSIQKNNQNNSLSIVLIY